ncbi:lipoprotein heptaprenylglyceryl N-acetyltransferase LhaT [Sporosarcina thermotolerans]
MSLSSLKNMAWLILTHKSFLWILLFVNIFGTVYGYDWYMWQLEMTDPIFWIFVPDSPTASLFFSIAIIGWLIGKNFKLIEALALITLVKYGLWAVVMNLLTLNELGSIDKVGWMLIGSHFAMAVQAILYSGMYKFDFKHIVIAAIWTLHNDVIDYVFGQMPIYYDLMKHMQQIGYFTFWLSIACITLAYIVWRKRVKRKTVIV